MSQSNAVSKAQDYLDYTSFSRQSLINQLMFEGFSNADATYAVDKVNPDWNEQAAKKAKEYLDYTSFSHDGLLQQLIYEGFTPDQAAYGVSQTGLSATTLPPAPAGTVSLSTFNGGGDLNVRSGPGSANALVGTVSDGGSISALCQTTGEDIEGPGGETATWVKILAPANGWVSAAFISSPITLPSC